MKTVLISFLFVIGALWVVAQEPVDTSLNLPQVSVQWSQDFFRESGRDWYKTDSLLLRQNTLQNLANLLFLSQSGYIKAYGPAGVATSSLRGGSAAHTAVLWNGINVQSPMLGQTDFSLFPGVLTDEIYISKSGSAVTGIQGAIGGAIQLKNKFSEQGFLFNIDNSTGSFGAFGNAVKVHYGKGKIKLITRAFYHRANNDFTFKGLHGDLKKLSHAKVQQWGVVQDISLKTGRNSVLEGHFWKQVSHRELPPNKLQAKSVAFQEDDSWRNVLQWRRWTDTHAFSFTGAFLTDQLNYQDSIVLINSQSTSNTFNLKADQQYYPEFGHIRIALEYQFVKVNSNNYDFSPKRNTWTGNASFRKNWEQLKLEAEFNLATSIVDGQGQPVLPGVRLEWKSEKVATNLGVNRNFRIPTFNDLYWEPGGNQDLQPEQSWNLEAGWSFNHLFEKKKVHWQINAQSFSRVVDNWILWQPAGSYWQPVNARKVWSRGLELESSLGRNYPKGYWRLKGNYHLTRSTILETADGSSDNIGKQLIYQPTHMAGITLVGNYKKFTATYIQRWTGKVYTSTDNLHDLEGFALGQVAMERQFNFRSAQFTIGATVFNVFDQSYEVVAFYPMPGRNYQLKLSTKIN